MAKPGRSLDEINALAELIGRDPEDVHGEVVIARGGRPIHPRRFAQLWALRAASAALGTPLRQVPARAADLSRGRAVLKIHWRDNDGSEWGHFALLEDGIVHDPAWGCPRDLRSPLAHYLRCVNGRVTTALLPLPTGRLSQED